MGPENFKDLHTATVVKLSSAILQGSLRPYSGHRKVKIIFTTILRSSAFFTVLSFTLRVQHESRQWQQTKLEPCLPRRHTPEVKNMSFPLKSVLGKAVKVSDFIKS